METALTTLLAIASGVTGFVAGGHLGFTSGSLLSALLTGVHLAETGVRQGILTLEQAEALGQILGRQIGEALPQLKQFLQSWEVTEEVPNTEVPENEAESIGANRFVRGMIQELRR